MSFIVNYFYVKLILNNNKPLIYKFINFAISIILHTFILVGIRVFWDPHDTKNSITFNRMLGGGQA